MTSLMVDVGDAVWVVRRVITNGDERQWSYEATPGRVISVGKYRLSYVTHPGGHVQFGSFADVYLSEAAARAAVVARTGAELVGTPVEADTPFVNEL